MQTDSLLARSLLACHQIQQQAASACRHQAKLLCVPQQPQVVKQCVKHMHIC